MKLGDAIDPATLIRERWFAAPVRPIKSIVVEDRFELPTGGALAILRVEIAEGTVARRTQPIDDERGAPWPDLLNLATRGGLIKGPGGSRLMGTPPRGPRAPRATREADRPNRSVRPLGKDQSHTSVVIDEMLVLKLYRALTPGVNPEVELGGALAADPQAPVPAFRGAVRVELPAGGSFALAIVQDFVPGAGDAFEELAERLSAWLRAGAPQRALASLMVDAGPAGLAAAHLHASLRSVVGRAFGTRAAIAADGHAWRRDADRAFRAVTRMLPAVDPGRAAWLSGRQGEIDRALAPLSDPDAVARAGTLQRIHADLHLGQLLRDGDRFLLGDLEGEPGRAAAERRRLDMPLRDLASMLRSFDHVARSGMRRSGVPLDQVAAGTSAADPAIEAWLAAMRTTFLDAYVAESAARDTAVVIDPRLLHALEVVKELYEFAYAATYLPAWMYAPSAGMRWLLDHSPG